MQFLNQEEKEDANRYGKMDYYLDQIALEMRRTASKKRWGLKDFLIKFRFDKPKKLTEHERTQKTKNFVLKTLGMK